MAIPQDVSAETFRTVVLEATGPVLVDFWSQTCPHCLHFAPAFADAAETGPAEMTFAKVSLQEARPLFAEYGISGVPTILLFRQGEVVARQSGAMTAEEMLSWVEEHAAQ